VAFVDADLAEAATAGESVTRGVGGEELADELQ
jgi:hypothetical protein